MTPKQRVLVVDDEPRNQRIVAEILEDWVDFKVASTGEEALAFIGEYSPDLVLLDIMMPGIDGYEVCRKIRANPKLALVKVILVSGKAMIEERLKGYEAGADDYMTKPFVPEELHAKATVFLRLAFVERELTELNLSLEEKVEQRTRQLLETEARLLSTAKMTALGEMAGGIAHEINTPLGTIGMIVEQIRELVGEDPLDKTTISDLTRIADETVQRIGGIIRGLKTFSRDGSRDRFDSVPLKQVVESTLSFCREKLKHGEVQVLVDPIPDDYSVLCRQVEISQVLLNLINNSYDAVQPLQQKWIRISVEKQEGGFRLSVTDSGSGVSDEARKKIFQPFFTTKEVGKGTGLGLSVSKGIMDAHQGSLSLDPLCPNTRFVLNFPWKKAA